uniref:Uncharacterized protein n=1 Tax=viral metagenome TaxID=1070528 RepID=A0A6M3LEU0_9ZZZZ
MKYEAGKNGSYLHNCVIVRRENDPVEMLFRNDDNITAFLNGYAIIPLEEYYKLAGKGDFSYWKKLIEEADKYIHKDK